MRANIGHGVGCLDCRRAWVVGSEVPGDDLLPADARPRLERRRGPKVGPGKLFRPSPAERNRLAGRPGQSRSLDGDFARVLAPESPARVGNDYARLVGSEAERLSQLLANTERPLRAGPDSKAVFIPLGDRRTRLQRRVLDIGHLVGSLEGLSSCQRTVDVAALAASRSATPPGTRLCMSLQVGPEALARRMGRGPPSCGLADRLQRLPRLVRRPRGAADEFSVAHRHCAQFPAGSEIDALELRSVRRRAQDRAVQHVGTHDVGGIAVSAGDDLARSDLGQGLAQHPPVTDLPQRNSPGDVIVNGCFQPLRARQVGIGEPIARADYGSGFHAQFGSVEIPCFRRRPHKQLAGGGARPPNHRYRRWRRPTARGRAIVRCFGRVRQHHLQRVGGNAEFFGRRLEDFGSGALANLHLARQHGDRSVLAQMQPVR